MTSAALSRVTTQPAALFITFLFFPACASSPPPQEVLVPVTDTVVVVDTVEVTAGPDPAIEQRVARLQLQLLEKDAQIVELQERLVAARQEVVRTMAKLQSQATRAEAASGIAEAEIALDALEAAAGRRTAPEVAQSQQLLQMGTVEFDKGNYGGSLYLATQARNLAKSGERRLRGGGQASRQPGEVLFAIPVPLRTLGRSNVRDGPGLQFEVIYTLNRGTSVVGQSYTDQWVHISDGQGRTGWIFYSLVGSRN